MPDPQTQDPPVKKNPFILSPDELKAAAPKMPTADQQPKKNPFVLDQADLQSVKKKDGTNVSGSGSGPTPSPSLSADVTVDPELKGLSPEGLKTYNEANKGPKMSDLYNQTYSLLNEGIPASLDPKINGQRQQLLSGVKSGDQGAITTAKNHIKTGLQKQIDKVRADATQTVPGGNMFAPTSETFFNPSPDQKQIIDGLTKKMQQVDQTMNDYAVNAAANSKEIQTQVRAEVSGKQYMVMPNLAAEDLGKQIEKINGGLPNPNGNIQYERQRAGLNAIIQNKQLKINDLLANGLKSKNVAMLTQAHQEMAEQEILKGRANNLIDQFPDVATTQVARIIGDEIAESHPKNMVISKSDVLESADRIEKKYPGFTKKYGKFINTVAESEGDGIFGQFKEGMVPKGGFSGGINAGLNELQYGGAKFVAGVLGDDKTAQFADAMEQSPFSKGTKQTGGTPTKVVYDDKGQALVEKPNEDYGKINWNSSTNFIGRSIPGLAEWVVAEEATGGVAGLAGAGKAAKATAGLVGASYVTSYDGNHKIAESLIDDNSTLGEAKKTALANLFTLTTAGAFKMVGYSPTKFVENAVTRAIAPDVLAALEENGWKQLPKNKMTELLTDKIIPKVKTFAVETAKSIGEGGKVAAAQLADQKVKDFVSQVVNPEKANATTLDENIKSTAQQILFMTLVGTAGGLKPGLAAYDAPSVKDAFYEIGTRAPQYIDRINEGVTNGDYTQEQGNKMIATAKTIAEEVSKAQNDTNKDGLPLTVRQKRDVAVANFRKRAAKAMEESGIPVSSEKANNDADEQIKNTKSQNTHLPLEETEAFKTAVEVDKEGNEIGKPKSVDDITDNKKYKYSKNGRETTTSGLELLSHIPNSNEYEEPEVKETDNAKSKTENAETPESKNAEDKGAPEIKDATKLLQKSELPGVYGELAKTNPEAVLKEISQQAHGIDSEGNPLEGGSREENMKKDYPPELVDAAMKAFPKESILSSKTDTNVKDQSTSKDHDPQEGSSQKEGDYQGSGQRETEPQGNVENKGGSAEKEPSPSKQKQINETLDKIKKYNSEAKGETKRAMLNEVRLTVQNDLPGYKIDYRNGTIHGLKNESGKYAQSRSEETNRTEKSFDKTGYHPDVHDIVNGAAADPVNANGLVVKGADGRNMSDKQVKSALKDIREGKDTVGAKAVYDAIAGMHERGIVDVKSPSGQEAGIPFKDYMDAFKEPLKEISDEDIAALHGEIGDDEFTKLFNDTLNDTENEPVTNTPEKTEQPAIGQTSEGKEGTGQSQQTTEVNNQSQPQQAAASLRESAGRLAEEGDRDGAIALYQQADRIESGTPPPGGKTDTEGSEPSGSTGVKKAVIEEERNLAGKTKIENQLRRDFGDVLEGGKKLIKDNGTNFVTALKNSIDHFLRPLTAEETVALSLRKAELQNDTKKVAQQILDHIKSGNNGAETEARMVMETINIERDNIDRIATKTNYEKGLSLAVNKLLIQEDYSAEKLVQKAKALTSDGEISEAQQKKLEDLSAKLEDAQKRLEEQNERISKLEADRKVKELAKEASADKIKAKKEKILAERKNLIDQFKKEIKGDPNAPKQQGIGLTDKMVGIIAKLARNYVQDGVVRLEEVVGNILNDLKEHAEGLDERNIRDAISGYGQPKRETFTDLAKKMSDLRKHAELLSKIEDVNEGKVPEKYKKSVKEWSEQVTKLKQELADLTKPEKKEKPEPLTPEQKHIKQMEKELDDLQQGIVKERAEKREYTPEEKSLQGKIFKAKQDLGLIPSKPLPKKPEATLTPAEKSIKRLEKELEDLSNGIVKQREVSREPTPEEKSLKEKIFEAKKKLGLIASKPEKTQMEKDEQALEGKKNAIKKRIDDIEKRIASKNFNPDKPNSLTDSELTELQKQNLDARQKLMDAMVESGIDPYNIKALKQFKTRLNNEKAKLQDKIAKGNYAKEVKRTLVKDREADKLQAEVEGLKSQINKELKKIELAERPKWLKRMDTLTKWRRAVLLSSVATLGKLTSAAMERSITTPLEELAGSFIHIIPGLREISKAAPREGGGISWDAEVAAGSVWFDKATYQEAYKTFKEDKGSLDLLLGKQKDLPTEAIDAIGRIHAALKTPAKLNEFKRALVKRNAWAIRQGFDVLDPVTQQTIRTQSYMDAKRSIFLQDNLLTDAYQTAIEHLTRKGPSGQVTADVLRMMLPIVKVPTNFAWESASYAAGALKAMPNIIKAIRGGVDSLEPNEADFVIRALKKQGVGIGMMTLGYMASGSVGGYYTGKRKEGDLKAGDIKLFGHDVPHWLMHAPLIEMLQVGATLRRVTDTYAAKGEDGKSAAVLGATKGLFGQVPFFNTAGTLGNALQNTKSVGSFAGEFAKSFVVPPTVQQVAAHYDTDEKGNPVERKPQTALEHIETGIPGLREKVTTKAEAAEQAKEKRHADYERKKEQKEAAEAEQQ